MELREIKFKYYKPGDIVGSLNRSMVDYKTCSAWCDLKGCFLTVRQMKNKQCLGKQCKALAIIPENNFWKRRQEKLDSKKRKKKSA